MRLALALVLLVGCGDKKKAPPAPTPASGSVVAVVDAAPAASAALVDGIRGLCATSDLNVAEAAKAKMDWTASLEATGNKEFIDVYLAALDGDDAALGKLRAAADVAAGAGKCSALDSVVKSARERNAEIAALPLPEAASDALVADMKHFCKGVEGLAEMNPRSVGELNILVAKGAYDKARDAVKQAKLNDCAPLEQMIENQRAREGRAK